jgi:hypothetical protein
VLTYRTGAAGAPSAAIAMAAHLLEQTLPTAQAELAAYYQRGLTPESWDIATAEPRRDMDPALAKLLGLDPNRPASLDEIAAVLSGNRADGDRIPGKQIQRATQSLAAELNLDPLRAPAPEEIDHILAGRRADGEALPEGRGPILCKRFLEIYGVHGGRVLTEVELAHIKAGRRADGEALRPGQLAEALSATRARIGYIDLCWSAGKSVSLAWAFAPTDAERAIIMQAHKGSVRAALSYVEAEIGRARKGKAGRSGFDSGQIGWISFDHYASRPTVETARVDPKTGEAYTELVTLKVAGDPQLHTHVAIPNVVLTAAGRIGGLDLQRLEGRVHEFGAYYQAQLATRLRRQGVAVVLDPETGAARIAAIPKHVLEAFSKRTMNGTEAARSYAKELGLDWDSLDPARKIGLAKRGVQGDPRQVKQDDMSDWTAWRRQAQALGWTHQSVLNRAAGQEPPAGAARIAEAYEAALGMLDKSLRRRAVVNGAAARIAAARGLIASGVESPADIDAVMDAFATKGVRQEGERVGLVWGVTRDAHGRETLEATTTLHISRETELVELARSATADRAATLSLAQIDAAVARGDKDFGSIGHGRSQRALMNAVGTGGRLGVAIGVAGSGKSTLLAPLVDAWQRDGRRVYGAALAWRQADDLAGSGIADEDRMALARFLKNAERGRISLDRDSVVVIDELGLLGARQFLDLLRLQKERGFQLVTVGDPKQCQSIEAGPLIDLLRRALGPEAVPEILTSIRQESERERETVLMFREGRAAEALALKRADRTARLVPGGYREAVEHAAALRQERQGANAHDPGYVLTVSAPTNADARAIGAEIRKLRRAEGEVSADQVVLHACDQNGASYELPLAIGDRVRLFDRVNASFEGRGRGNIGNNGSVLEVLAIDAAGLTLRSAQGSIGKVSWDSLRDRTSGKIRLSYGDVLTVQAAQGVTSTEHILAMPGGSRSVDAFTAYTGSSRHRRASYLVTSDGAERKEIAGRRPLGDTRLVREADVWANMARNLARQAEAPSALGFLERAQSVHQGAAEALQQGLQPLEQREVDGQVRATLGRTFGRRRVAAQVARLVEPLRELARNQAEKVAGLVQAMSTTLRAVVEMAPEIQSSIRQAAARLTADPERIRWRKIEEQRRQELDAIRARLLQVRVIQWSEKANQGWSPREDRKVSEARQARGKEAEEGMKAEITAIPEAELRSIEAQWKLEELKRGAEQNARPTRRPRSPGPGM